MPVDNVDIWQSCDKCCCRGPPRPAQRTVHINRESSIVAELEKKDLYPDNKVVTSKYTWWNFLPKNLFEQFMRIANSFFLATAIIQLANPDSPTSWATSVLPLIFVLLVTAVKQAYEDFLRHKEDHKINSRPIDLVQGDQIKAVRSKNLRIGNIIRVLKNDPFPCDLILLSSSSPTGDCYVTTAGLDGETNLKTYRCVRETKMLTDARSLSAVRGVIECEQPTVHLYEFMGRILLDSRTIGACGPSNSDVAKPIITQPTQSGADGIANVAFEANGDDRHVTINEINAFTNPAYIQEPDAPSQARIDAPRSAPTSADPNVVKAPLDEKNLLLRGARLRNTEFIFGCVIYTGPETKLALNSCGKRAKMSVVEKRLNIFLIIMFSLLMVITFLSTGLIYYYRNSSVIINAWYLQTTLPDNTGGQGVIDWLNYFLLYSYAIPISLYVTIELQKFIGALFFGWDEQMFESKRCERARANTSDLNEELGQIEYLFSDKTGTLTENEMLFRECSVNGTRYTDVDGRLCTRSGAQSDAVELAPVTQSNDELCMFLKALALCHTCRVECAESAEVQNQTNRLLVRRESAVKRPIPKITTSHHVSLPPQIGDKHIKMIQVHKHKLEDEFSALGDAKEQQQKNGISPDPAALTGEEAGVLKASGGLYEYHASSPDEKALLIATRRYGVVYHGVIDDNAMLISVNRNLQSEDQPASLTDWKYERYRLHHVLEFDSTRKCMSVVVETEEGEYWLITKGAETSMFQRAASGSDLKQREIMEHIVQYANCGLRTLVIGKRSISRDEFVEISDMLKNAQLAIENRAAALQAAYRAIEHNLELLGATGVEDRLQDGVGETIENLRAAGIVVWVLTGDKEETAVNIAQSCALFNDDMRVLRFTQQSDAASCGRVLRTLTEQTVVEPSASSHRTPDAPQYALVIDGASLAFVLNTEESEHETLQNLLIDLCLKCTSVLCCRVTPLQKAEIVKLVKRGVKGAITCAIGDGANDVSMIQEAHVGLGIFGMEGRQAALTSDYCFARFRYLSRVLLLHGHFYYHRIAVLVLYFFYKNLVFTLNQFLYQFLCAYSEVSLYDTISLAIFNITYTTLPILAFGLFEQHINRDLLLSKPELYRLARRNATLSVDNFLRWLLLGLYQTGVITFGSYIYFQFTTESTLPDGEPLDSYAFGVFTLMCVILIVNIRLMIEWRYWSAFSASFPITIIPGFYGILLVSEARLWSVSSLNYSYYVFVKVLSYGTNWLLCFGIIMVALLPDVLLKAISDTRSSEGKLRLENAIRRSRLQPESQARSSVHEIEEPGDRPVHLAANGNGIVNASFQINGSTNDDVDVTSKF